MTVLINAIAAAAEKIFQLDTATLRGSNGNIRFSSSFPSHVCDMKRNFCCSRALSRMRKSGLYGEEEKATGCERIENLRVG